MQILNKNNTKATFFVLGWIAEKYPEVVKEISKCGYDIGSHSHTHQLAYNQNRLSFREDIKKSIYTIEDCIGKKVTMFRAPGFSITSKNTWAFEVLYDLGIRTDCSVFPASRAHGGMPYINNKTPFIVSYNGKKLKEFPINTHTIIGKKIIFSGGGYFRFFPYSVIKKLTKRSEYVMTYFHPRDFDYNQPVLWNLDKIKLFKSYIGLKGSRKKLESYLLDFNFIDIRTADSDIKWDSVQNVRI